MIHHKGTNSIETNRLFLRRFEDRDAEAMYNNWASDPEAVKFLPWGPHQNPEVTRKRVRDIIVRYENNNYYNWAICRKYNNIAIGSISVELFNDLEQSCEVGYCLSREFWSRGIMTEALRAVMHYLFYEISYQKIVARHDVLNIASGRVMQKSGMSFEKLLYHVSRRRDGSDCDCAVYRKYIWEDA